MRQHVVICSPLTLFAFLGIIRQAFDNFMIEQTSQEILGLLGKFGQQWGKYAESVDKVKRQFDTVSRSFDELAGTRRRQLERHLAAIDDVRRKQALPIDGELFGGYDTTGRRRAESFQTGRSTTCANSVPDRGTLVPMSQIAFDLDLDDGGEPTYTVGELAEAINGALHRRFSDGLWVRGEIQGWNKSAAGHIYFNLVEVDDRNAKSTVRVAFFAGAQHGPRERFRRAGLKLGDGLKVRIFGGLDFFGGSGQVTLKMTDIDPRFTLGEMAIQRDEVVRRLVATGLFDANRRVPAVGRAVAGRGGRQPGQRGLGRLPPRDRAQRRSASSWRWPTCACRARRRCTWSARPSPRSAGATISTWSSSSAVAAPAPSWPPSTTRRSPSPSPPARCRCSPGSGHEIDRSVADEVAHAR